MPDQKVELKCEMCGEDFEIFARNYEKFVQEDQPILCYKCFGNVMEEQDKITVPERKKFEYMIASTGEWSDTETKNETIAYMMYGQDGWELIQIANNKAYFKREYIKGL